MDRFKSSQNCSSYLDAAAAAAEAGTGQPRWDAAAGVVGERANLAGVAFQSPNDWTRDVCVEAGGVQQTCVAFMLNTFAALHPGLVKRAAGKLGNKQSGL